MRIQEVEIYSDATNAVVLRHPERRYPGCLVQGDSLHGLVKSLEVVQKESQALSADVADELADVSRTLVDLLANYAAILTAHGIDLPFNGSKCE